MSTQKPPEGSTAEWLKGLEKKMTPEHLALREKTKAAALESAKKSVSEESFRKQQELFGASRLIRN